MQSPATISFNATSAITSNPLHSSPGKYQISSFKHNRGLKKCFLFHLYKIEQSMKIVIYYLVTVTHSEKCILNDFVVRCIDLNYGAHNPKTQRHRLIEHNPITSLIKHCQESHGNVDKLSPMCVKFLALQALLEIFILSVGFYIYFLIYSLNIPHLITMYHDLIDFLFLHPILPKLSSQ